MRRKTLSRYRQSPDEVSHFDFFRLHDPGRWETAADRERARAVLVASLLAWGDLPIAERERMSDPIARWCASCGVKAPAWAHLPAWWSPDLLDDLPGIPPRQRERRPPKAEVTP